MSEKRKITRNPVWPGTKARFAYRKPGELSFKNASAGVINLGSRGMFMETPLWLPSHTELDIQILFQPDKPQGLTVTASGIVVRADNHGLGVQFTDINLKRLGDCIIAMLNETVAPENYLRLGGSYRAHNTYLRLPSSH